MPGALILGQTWRTDVFRRARAFPVSFFLLRPSVWCPSLSCKFYLQANHFVINNWERVGTIIRFFFLALCPCFFSVLVTVVTETESDGKLEKCSSCSPEQENFIVCLLCWCASYLGAANLDLRSIVSASVLVPHSSSLTSCFWPMPCTPPLSCVTCDMDRGFLDMAGHAYRC